MHAFFKNIAAALFPMSCVHCKKIIPNATVPLCETCISHITISSGLYCPACNRRIPDGKSCHSENKYILAPATSFGIPEVRSAIHALKYQNLTSIMPALVEIVSKYYSYFLEPVIRESKNSWIAIPVPLHKSKLKKRGFNQAELLYNALATKGVALPQLHTNTLIRTRNTPSQTHCKNFELRAANVKNCFVIKNPTIDLKKNILLIDDVSTSGATLHETAVTLKNAGAKKIIALVIAKA